MMKKRTKIVCTIGPASSSPAILEKMIKAGMNVARLNFSHGTYAEHAQLIKNIRTASKKTGVVIALLQDLQGPRIRLGELPKEGVRVKQGDAVAFTTAPKKSSQGIPVTYAHLHAEIKKGHRILIADGVFEFVVTRVSGNTITCTAKTSAHLTSHKGMNFPDTNLGISSLSTKDKKDLEFGITQGVDFVALSFVRAQQDVIALKKLITRLEKKHRVSEATPPKVIVKIEKPEAVNNFESIVSESDGVMIARGDLGIELDAHDVPVVQKRMIARCNQVAKPVIVATQMLESMIINPRPTRAEISDVANAVIDHTDAVMLSGETAMGKYPVQAVQFMANTAKEIEDSHLDDIVNAELMTKYFEDEGIASATLTLSKKNNVKAIVVASLSGSTARLVAKYRPEIPILVTTDSPRVQRQLTLSWGLLPLYVPKVHDIDVLAKRAVIYLKKKKLVKTGDGIIVVKGSQGGKKYPLKANKAQLKGIELVVVK